MPLVFDYVSRNDFESDKQRLSLVPPMGFDETDDDVLALPPRGLRRQQHPMGFTHAGCRTKEDFQPAKRLPNLRHAGEVGHLWVSYQDHIVVVLSALQAVMFSKVGDFAARFALLPDPTLLGGLSTHTIVCGTSFPCRRPGGLIC
jgi:hypothetical protein